VSFHLLKGPVRKDHVLYASHSVWESEDHFRAWTRSEQFRDSHRGAGQNRDLYLGPPEFEGFTAVIHQTQRVA
jgi:heme-degrading monooxygenase HmoA